MSKPIKVPNDVHSELVRISIGRETFGDVIRRLLAIREKVLGLTEFLSQTWPDGK